MGIIFAFIALFAWGMGDFLIQKSARKMGDWIALFYVAIFGMVALFPFVYKDFGDLLHNPYHLSILSLTGFFILFGSLFQFESLRTGKLSVVEPVLAMELPVAAFIAYMLFNERLSVSQIIIACILFVGIFLVSARHLHHFKGAHLEKGVYLAIGGAIFMGVTSVLFGMGGREISPLMVNFAVNVFLATSCLMYILFSSRHEELLSDWKHNKKLILRMVTFDNLAWVAFTYSMVYIPVAISTGISESYIAMAGILGFAINKEKLKKHQWAGLVICIFSAIALGFISK